MRTIPLILGLVVLGHVWLVALFLCVQWIRRTLNGRSGYAIEMGIVALAPWPNYAVLLLWLIFVIEHARGNIHGPYQAATIALSPVAGDF